MSEHMKKIKKQLIDKDITFTKLVALSKFKSAWGLRKAINRGSLKTLSEIKEILNRM
ncbi:hypothetical protein [Psychrilyobacter sp.]|uniref:hypothetical protein n=1 Tax=Psychrilyobacter sp. TaxID=2586924 RepID=UPI003C70BE79